MIDRWVGIVGAVPGCPLTVVLVVAVLALSYVAGLSQVSANGVQGGLRFAGLLRGIAGVTTAIVLLCEKSSGCCFCPLSRLLFRLLSEQGLQVRW